MNKLPTSGSILLLVDLFERLSLSPQDSKGRELVGAVKGRLCCDLVASD